MMVWVYVVMWVQMGRLQWPVHVRCWPSTELKTRARTVRTSRGTVEPTTKKNTVVFSIVDLGWCEAKKGRLRVLQWNDSDFRLHCATLLRNSELKKKKKKTQQATWEISVTFKHKPFRIWCDFLIEHHRLPLQTDDNIIQLRTLYIHQMVQHPEAPAPLQHKPLYGRLPTLNINELNGVVVVMLLEYHSTFSPCSFVEPFIKQSFPWSCPIAAELWDPLEKPKQQSPRLPLVPLSLPSPIEIEHMELRVKGQHEGGGLMKRLPAHTPPPRSTAHFAVGHGGSFSKKGVRPVSHSLQHHLRLPGGSEAPTDDPSSLLRPPACWTLTGSTWPHREDESTQPWHSASRHMDDKHVLGSDRSSL